jgi:NHL repeat
MNRVTFSILAVAMATGSVITSCTRSWNSPATTAKTQVTTFAGNGQPGIANGPWLQASFNTPYSLAVDTLGNVYVGDYDNNDIRLISPVFGVSTFGGNTPADSGNGVPNDTLFLSPSGIAINSAGTFYITDNYHVVIIKISPSSVVTNFAGSGVNNGCDGPLCSGMSGAFSSIFGVAVDSKGYLYVADFDDNAIIKISPTGFVTTFAGDNGGGRTDGVGTSATFSGPIGVAVNAAGVVYVTDEFNNLIRQISPSGVVTTLAGSGTAGSDDGLGVFASFNGPTGIAVDRQGNIYVSDSHNNKIRKIDSLGGVITLAGTGQAGAANGGYTTATFNSPFGIAVDIAGNVYVADLGNNLIRKITQ